ncbi:MAG TPA: PD-(D/E)XK nuclease family protein [Kiritimatiellia bacterium]|nr:PD-(D/E)XK nuclease family protein [Kiritimatiellia bacterium]HRU71177.1 PD-(D/E)XK nuclease family protein [Kiritimatiellia bacterium]
MPVTRTFIGWERPLCETVSAFLLAPSSGGLLDLRHTTVIVPTRQSSWRLRAALPLAADARGVACIGPEIVTPPVLLAPPQQAGVASGFQSLRTWTDTLKTIGADEFRAFLGAGDKRPSTTAWALQIARQLQRLRQELADGDLTLADVADRGDALEEAECWADMKALEGRYLERLAAQGLQDATAAKLAHVRAGVPPAEIARVVVAAVPDPPRLLEKLLARWGEAGVTVDILVAAPDNETHAFDDWGRPAPDVWAKRHIALNDEDLWLEATPADQAARIAKSVATSLKTQPRPTGTRPQLAIGVPDRETVAPLQRALADLGLPAFDPQNRPFSQTPLARLVHALLALRDSDGYDEVAALLRHPDVLHALECGADVLRELDAFQSEYLPVTLNDLCDHGPADTGHNAQITALPAAVAQVRAWRARLQQGDLATGLREVLQHIFKKRQLKSDNPDDAIFQQAVTVFDDCLRELETANPDGQAGRDDADILLARLRESSVKPERQGEPLDLEGWLELAWNPAPLLFVAGMNEGFVPDGHVGDLFLPDALRTRLGLRDDRLRVARDAYVLEALIAQRRSGGRPILVVGKTSTAGDPLRPSRLLFRCPDAELVTRAKKLFRETPPPGTASAFTIGFKLDPRRVPSDSINPKRRQVLSPTLFRDYLESPLQFYLKHVLDMEALSDREREPDALAFGTLVHAVLDEMAADRGLWACGDAGKLGHWMENRMRALAHARYGSRPWLGVELAVDSAVRRLRTFAQKQVEWHRQGWEIVEHEDTQGKRIMVDGVTVRGRIDRIDRRMENGKAVFCILDYKTADKAKMPVQAHVGPPFGDSEFLKAAQIPKALMPNSKTDKRWADLQLPLYREFVKTQCEGEIRLGYVNLPSALGDIAFNLWDTYTDALHASAMACAQAVVENIKAGKFQQAGRPRFEGDFGGLLLGDAAKTIEPPPPPWSADS